MRKQISRRNFMRSVAAASSATIIGLGSRAIMPAQAQTQQFRDIPKLDGVLLFDEASRKAIAVDGSNIFHGIPAAVLKPGSVQDIVETVGYANRHALKVAIKGHGHATYGQSQAEGGIVIDFQSSAPDSRSPRTLADIIGWCLSSVMLCVSVQSPAFTGLFIFQLAASPRGPISLR